MRPLAFAKYEGLSNDFVILEAADEAACTGVDAIAICDRHRGIGADGVIFVLPARESAAQARMRVLNADGSIAQMCGNGLRCVARYIARRDGRRELLIETDAGALRCSVADDAVTVEMGLVRSLGPRAVRVDDRSFEVWVADAGNPHAVVFDPQGESIEWLGSRLAMHRDFPGGINVGLVTLRDGRVDLVVWERGVGVTLACGTNACAAVAVACDRGLLRSGVPTEVHLPGGTLTIGHSATGLTTMRGPARHVFSGELAGSAEQ
jgi:diaminopimelate epimerase